MYTAEYEIASQVTLNEIDYYHDDSPENYLRTTMSDWNVKIKLTVQATANLWATSLRRI
jgi:hypothetical protein